MEKNNEQSTDKVGQEKCNETLLENDNYADCIDYIVLYGKRIPLRVPREKVPKLMWEPAIYTGYRPIHQPWTYYIRSLFWIHNETGNTWIHVVAPYLILAMIYFLLSDIDFMNDSSSHGILLFAVTSCIAFFCSALAHLLHSKSIRTFHLMFCFDYIGIAFSHYGFGMMFFYCSGTELYYRKLGNCFPILHAALSCNIAISNIIAMLKFRGTPIGKCLQVVPCVLTIITSFTVMVFRAYACYTENLQLYRPNIYVLFAAIFIMLNGLTFSCHMPERLFPGKFDFFGHGHQWFHLTIILTTASGIYAAYRDLLTIPREVLEMANPSITRIWTSFVAVFVVNLTVVAIFYAIYQKSPKSKNFSKQSEIESYV